MKLKLHKRLRGWLLAGIALLTASPSALAANGDDFTFEYEGQTLTYTIISEADKTCETKEGSAGYYYTGGNSVSGNLTIPSTANGYSVIEIGESSFYKCSGLTSVAIPNSVTTIGDAAFYGCSGLTSVTIPNSVTTIQGRAFRGCSGLTSVTIPNSVTTIGDEAFYGCSGLTSVDIPNSVTVIRYSAFNRCSGLTSVTIPNSVTTIQGRAFYGCSGLTSVTIPNSVTTLSYLAFGDCTGLISVVIGNSVTSVDDNTVFQGCSNLLKSAYPNTLSSNPFPRGFATQYPHTATFDDNGVIYDDNQLYFAPVTFEGAYAISDGIKIIGDRAFWLCKKLTAVTLPETISSIGEYAFYACDALVDINSLASTAPSADEDCFDNLYDKAKLTVDDNSVSSYAGTYPWSLFDLINDAPRYSDDVFTYRLFSSEGTAMLVKNGSITYTMETASIPSRLAVETEGEDAKFYQVTAIGANAFNGCTRLTKITWPRNLTTIGDGAFKGCTGLTEITLPSKVTTIGASAFENATKLTDITLPETLTGIGSSAFRSCTGLTTIELPQNVSSIGSSAFRSCTGLTEMTLPNSVTSLGSNAFAGDNKLSSVTLSESLTEIADSTFLNCTGLTEINMPDAITTVGTSAFEGATGLKTIKFSESLDSIAPRGFYGCTGWTELTLPNSLTVIGESAFESNSNLANITLSESLETIAERAFYGLSLTTVSIPASVTSIGYEAFYNYGRMKSLTIEDSDLALEIDNYAFYLDPVNDLYMGRNWTYGGTQSLWTGIKTVTLSNNVTALSQYAFKNCTNLTGVTIPNSLESIGEEAFNGCTALETVNFGGKVKSIANSAFNNCKLTEVVIPGSVETIGDNAFAANSLTSVTMGYGVTTIGEKAFDGSNALATINITAVNPPAAQNNTFSYYGGQLYVAEGSVDAYYDCPRCWYRFEGEPLVMATALEGDSETSLTGKPGETIQLHVTMTPANATLQNIFWISTNEKVATVDHNGLVTMSGTPESDIQTYADEPEDGTCEIRAYSLYADVPAAVFKVNGISTGIDDIVNDAADNAEFDATQPYDVYNLSGMMMGHDKDIVTPGIYIVRQGKNVMKMAVK